MTYKYIVPYTSSLTEFLLYADAEQYASTLGVSTDLIFSSSYTTASISSDEIYNQKVKIGYNIPATPYYLGLDMSDRVQFSGMLSLLNEALQFGYVTTASMTMIRDKNYNDIPMSVIGFKQLMLGYGMYYKSIWDVREDPHEFNT